MTTTLSPQDVLQRFTAQHESRYSITKVFRCGDYACATDGKCVVRYPIDGINAAEIEKTPPVHDLPWSDEIGEPIEFDAPPEQPPIKCRECDGTGKQQKCPECDGEGVVECWECEHEHECRECEGTGKTRGIGESDTCEECDGLGTIPAPPVAVKCGHAHISDAYLRTLKEVGATLFSRKDRAWNKPMRFSLPDGGEGLVMPMNVSQ